MLEVQRRIRLNFEPRATAKRQSHNLSSVIAGQLLSPPFRPKPSYRLNLCVVHHQRPLLNDPAAMQKVTAILPSWDKTKSGSKKGFDKAWGWADKRE